jgi:dienelactone hydrolase
MSVVRRPRVRSLLAIAVGCALAGSGLAVAAPSPAGLPAVASGPRPGPSILYAPAADAPQLENTGVWKADPILVSGAQSYRDGEWLYQDFLQDDHGATGVRDPNDPYGASSHLYSLAGGTFTYPTDKVYANNAADLVELRVKPLADATAFRVTLNTLQDASRTGFTIALGDGGASVPWPAGAGVSSPAQVFLTWHGSTVEADVRTKPVAFLAKLTPTVDLPRRQVTIVVPHTMWNPGTSKVRTTVGVGLWNKDANTYLAPQPGAASATTPGGGTPQGVAIVNVGPRFNEPFPVVAGATMADTAVGGAVLDHWWRERQQSEQLAQGDVTPFSAQVDFGKLASKVHDDSGVPKSGPINRILASHYSYGQGIDPTHVCFAIGGPDLGPKCHGRFLGQLQAYSLYVPKKPVPAKGYGLTLLLHSLSANYNQYSASHNQSQLGDRGAGSLVVTPGGRGPDGFYKGIPEADTFETWADVARHYKVDADWSVVSGYSMGGFGTYRLLARWPDLFAKGFSVVGEPQTVSDQLVSLRNTPLLAWNSTEDELVNINTSENAVKANTAAGIRFEEDKFLTADHLTLAANDQYDAGAAFLGTDRVDRNPYHVTYVVDPTEDSAAATAVADHAYWVSDLKTRKAGIGTIDAVSAAFGITDAKVMPVTPGAGVLVGGEIPAMAYVSREQKWGPFGKAPKADALQLTLTNLRTATIDMSRAGLTCGAKLAVKTDGPVTVTLAGCGKTLSFG